MTERTTPPLDHDRYEGRLNSTKALPEYDSLDDEQKTLLGYLALDQDLDVLDFNEAVNGEIAKARVRMMGGAALTGTFEHAKVGDELPKTFEEAKQLSGHSIEDVVHDMQDIDEEGIEAAFGSIGELSDKDKAFYNDEFLSSHQESVNNITLGFMKRFPEEYRRQADDSTHGAYHKQEMFLQHDSPAYLRAKLVEGRTDKPSVRMYLNPELTDATAIYAELLNKALERKLRFKSKIIRANSKDTYNLVYKPKYLDQGLGKLDPIVIYGYEESKDELLKIVEEIHQSRPESFRGRKIGGSPLAIAEGIGVGDEVSDSGESSLTSSRESAANTILRELKDKNPNWDVASPEARKRVFMASLRKRYESLGYNPENVAFNA